MRRCCLTGAIFRLRCWSCATSPDLDLRAARLRAERDVLEKAIMRANGTLAAAAKLLGISRPTLYTLMEAHGLAPTALAGLDGAGDSAAVASRSPESEASEPRHPASTSTVR